MAGEDDWGSALTWMILPVGRTWYRAVSKAFDDFGMSFSTAAPILALAKLGDGSRQSVIAEAVGVDRAAMVRSIDQLESLGLVERRIDPEDGRGRRLYLTEQGRALARNLDVVAEDFRRRALAAIRPADVEAAVRALQALNQAAEEMLRGKKQE